MAATKQVVFHLDNEEYGVDIMKVNVIEKYQEIVKVPNSPEYIEGIINLRGEILPIFSLRKKFKLANKPIDDNTKIIVVFLGDMKMGFIVDSVSQIINIEESQLEAAPRIVTGVSRRYIQSVAKVGERMIVLLNVDLILEDEERLSLGTIFEENNG
ncbi:purine-binding chemotaxis protein CheW [Clostridiales bacterium COT073_COT-073]|nr:purine-binding chemotaxis protein CheW [Clostridiales bacterium COT073_COT-073]